MEWQQLLGFVQVARLGSFTQAAAATFRTQSALSQQIRALEASCGCPLLERLGKRRVRLTPAGERVLAFAHLVLRQQKDLEDELAAFQQFPHGRLLVAAPFTTLFHLLPHHFQTYRQKFPHVQLTILDRPQEEVLHLVRQGEVDIGFARQSIIPGDLQGLPWQPLGTVLMVPPDHPLTLADPLTLPDIARYPLILPPASLRYAGRRSLEEQFTRLGLTCQIAMESANAELSHRYVALGLGLAFATLAGDASRWPRRGLAFLPLDHLFPPDCLAIVLRPARTLPPYKTAFLDLLLAAAPPPPERAPGTP